MIHDAIYKLRKHLGWTQQQLGETVAPYGQCQALVSRWERAVYQPQAETLLALDDLAIANGHNDFIADCKKSVDSIKNVN